MQDKARESVSVLDFGAVGDGVADDTFAIQAAVNAAGLFGTVQFPSGTYKITSTITVPPVSGVVSGIIFTATGTATIRAAANLSAVFSATGCQCVFKNLSIDVGSSSTTSGIKVSIPTSNASLSATIIGCSISGFQKGLELSGQNYNIDRNFLLNNTRSIHFTNDGRNSYISKNYILGGSIGVQFSKTTQQCEGARIIDNTFLCTGQNGGSIIVDAGLEISVIGNIIDQNGSGTIGVYCNPSLGNTVSRLKITSNWICGGLNSYPCFFSGSTDNITLSSNTIAECNSQAVQAGISLNSINGVSVINNNSLLSNAGSGNDISAVSCLNFCQFGNLSTRGQAAFINNSTETEFTATAGLYSSKGVFGGQSVTGGSAAPSSVQPIGSIYMRTGSIVGQRLYVSQGGGSWLPVAGV
jgi:hypothetical protein